MRTSITDATERIKKGRPPKHPDDLRERVFITLPPDLVACIACAATEAGATRTAVIEKAVRVWLDMPAVPPPPVRRFTIPIPRPTDRRGP
jgi:hypothetical protein